MIPVFLDFETFWSKTHSLSVMSPIVYVMHPETELISCALKVGNGPTRVAFGELAISVMLSTVDWDNAMAIGHNMSAFDAMIMAWRLQIRPRMWGCTLAMARPLHAKTTGLSLAKLVAHYGIGVKNNAVLLNTRGKHLCDFTADELQAMRVYNTEDTDQDAALFHILKHHYTPDELWHIDCNIRMLVEPEFELDTGLLQTALSVERSNKHRALMDLARMIRINEPDWTNEDLIANEVKKDMMSAAKFSAVLEGQGIEVPQKRSKTDPTKFIAAIAKTDEAMLELLEHENEVVAAAARARLSAKSTQLETRIESFLENYSAVGAFPVPAHYCGADTTGRDSGFLYNCFAGDIEVLTPSGWCRFDAWDGRPVMQWWPDGRLTFEEHPGSMSRQHSGTVISFASRFVSGRFTPEHRFVSVADTKVGLKERTAEWIAAHSGLDRVPVSGVWCGARSSLFTPAEARLMAAIAADATVSGRQLRIGVRKTKKLKRAKELLEAAGVEYKVREYPPQLGHTGGGPTYHVNFQAGKFFKGLGPWIMDLNREALDALVDEFKYWDGWEHPVSKTTTLCTTCPTDAEWFVTATHLSGGAVRPRVVKKEAPHKDTYLLYTRASKYTSVATQSDVWVEPFNGRVYCASTESTYLLVRHNGTVFVTGQCLNLPRVDPGKPRVSDALRKSIRAKRGKKIIVSDLSGIELRVNHTLWQVQRSIEMWKQNPKADLYCGTADAYYGLPEGTIKKDDPRRQLGKVLDLSCGFQIGHVKLRDQARAQFGLRLSLDEAKNGVTSWRSRYPEISDRYDGGWAKCQDALTDIAAGRATSIDPAGLCWTEKDAIVLPSGRRIRYPNLRQEMVMRHREVDGRLESKMTPSWVYAGGRHTTYLYGGKVLENCIAEGTLVLTDRGFVPIEEVSASDLVHDGIEFVEHSGLVSRGVQECVAVDGVWMTPEHEVLTDEGWKQAVEAPRPWRPNIRSTDGAECGRIRARKADVEISVCMRAAVRQTRHTCNQRGEARRDSELRVGSVLQAETQPPAYTVYDIINAGPRRRFVVLGEGGPFVVHNCVQALARDIIFGQSIEFFKRTGLRPKHKVYDELVYVTDAAVAEELLAELQAVMRTPPKWWPELVLWTEGDVADCYADAK